MSYGQGKSSHRFDTFLRVNNPSKFNKTPKVPTINSKHKQCAYREGVTSI